MPPPAMKAEIDQVVNGSNTEQKSQPSPEHTNTLDEAFILPFAEGSERLKMG